jgi:hypothetical protein
MRATWAWVPVTSAASGLHSELLLRSMEDGGQLFEGVLLSLAPAEVVQLLPLQPLTANMLKVCEFGGLAGNWPACPPACQ